MDKIEKRHWKRIPGFEGYYASNTGEIYGKKSKKILNPRKRVGYLYCDITNTDGIRKSKSVHNLVASAWIPRQQNKKYVNHKNLNKSDNRVDNLEWCTQQENCQHSMQNGNDITHLKSIRMYEAITETVVEQRQAKKSKNDKKAYTRSYTITNVTKGKLLKEFKSVNDGLDYVNNLLKTKDELPIQRHTISKVLTGKNKTGAGYIWEYVEDPRVIIPENCVIIKDYPKYKCDRNGSIYRIDRNTMLKPIKNEDDRYYVTLSKTSNGGKNRYVHKIIAEAFIPNPEKKKNVRHINGDKSNNKVENLQWV